MKNTKKMKETKKLDLYINNFLDSYAKTHSYEELLEVCKRIIIGKKVEGLDEYSKKILSLSMEKQIIMSIEHDCKINKQKSNWIAIKKYFPLKEKDKDYLLQFIDLFLINRKRVNHKVKIMKDIQTFYNPLIESNIKSVANKLFKLPSGEKVSVSDLMLAINNSFNNLEQKPKKMKIKKKISKAFKMAVPIAGLTTALTFASLSNSKTNTKTEEDVSIVCVNESKEEFNFIDKFTKKPLFVEEKVEEDEEIQIVNVDADIIEIPADVKQSGICRNYTNYSYYYNKWNRTSNQRIIADEWHSAGRTNDRGIATLDGKYLVAMAKVFGNVGDNVIVVLENGESIDCIIADAKGADATNKYGHVLSSGVDIIEWESYGAKDKIELGSWKSQKVSHVINLDRTNNYTARR